MDSSPDRLRIPISRVGCAARGLTQDGNEGRVAAVFGSSFYLETRGSFACIGNTSVELSPLNLVAELPECMSWSASGMRRDDPWKISTGSIYVGTRYAFPLADAAAWGPQPVPAGWQADDLRRGLDELRRRAVDRLPAEGLGRLILRSPPSPPSQIVHGIAGAPVAGLRKWLSAAIRDPQGATSEALPWVYPLIGLGPGLTPSGDDFLGGVMIALHGLRQFEVLRRLWPLVRGCAVEAGNPISLAHLVVASEGMGSAPIHDMLSALLTGESAAIGDNLESVDRIGHTSGWDAIAGAVTALDAWLRVLSPQNET
jgi:hypothetical protein